MTDKKGLILNIQRMSTEDGPGIRTTVFFKGCSLTCPWCHNPESMKAGKEIEWIQVKCIGCRTCIAVCRQGALLMTDEGLQINREKCTLDLACVDACPGMALEVKGIEWSVDDLFRELIKDKAYFSHNSGGITLSGGEVLLQAEFAAALLHRLKQEGIHTAVDTCGYVTPRAIDRIFDDTDLFLYDIKIFDDAEHRKIIGQSNRLILENLQHIAAKIREGKRRRDPAKAIWIRTPVIPGSTDSTANIHGIARFLKENMEDEITRWELCAFNNLCSDKYRRLDREWKYRDALLIEKEQMDILRNAAIEAGMNPQKVIGTGATRL
ncbi:MAG: glycyl-radical enzyme activating protein [Eubacteriales bacterium]